MKVVHLHQPSSNKNPVLHPVFTSAKSEYRPRFLVNKGNSSIILQVKDIAYFHVSALILNAITFDHKEYLLDYCMKSFQKELDPGVFFRLNRQFMVNINSIHKIEPYFNGKIVVKTIPESGEKMLVSRQGAKAFKDWIDR